MAIIFINGLIDKTTSARIRAVCAGHADDLLTVIINSNGGTVAAAFAAADAITGHPGPTVARVSGRCHSAALLLLAACETRQAALGCSFGFHETWAKATELPGNLTAKRLRAHANELERQDQGCRAFIAQAIGCDIQTLVNLERRTTTITTIDAAKIGLITDIFGHPGVAARCHAQYNAERAGWSRQDVSAAARFGILNRPLSITPAAFRGILAERRR